MKKVFQFVKLPVLALMFGFIAVSCEDKKDNPSPNNNGSTNTEYNGTKYNIKNGFYENGGPMDYYFDEEAENKTHYNITMVLTDGTPVIKDGKAETMPDGKILIVATLLSPGANRFTAGTFEIGKDWIQDMLALDEDAYDAKYKNKFFVPIAWVFTDTDGDKNWEEETGTAISEGTFKVTGTAPNFTTEYDLKLAGNKTLKGSFTGRFTEITD